MATIHRTGSAVWHGTGREGKGTLSTQSGVLSETPYGFNTRFGDAKGTNPEELIAAGATNREAGEALFLSDRTVEHHLRNAYRKLGVRSRTELAACWST